MACNKDDAANLQKGLTLKAVASSDASRTSFDGGETEWSDGDNMTVLIEGATYQSPTAHQFTLSDKQSGKFQNTTAQIATSSRYNFYAVYPHTAQVTEGTTTARISIGAASQEQSSSSPAHIAALDPLTGCAEDVEPTDVSIAMNHNAAVLVLNVNNGLSESINGIKSVTIEAPEAVALCGEFDVDIASGSIANPSSSSNIVTVNVSNSGAVESGDVFCVYAAIAPVELGAGESLKFCVTTTDDEEYSFTKTFASGRTISAADLLSTTLTLEKQELPAEITYEYDFTDYSTYPENITSASGEKAYYTFDGQEIGLENDGGYGKGGTDYFLRFKNVTSAGTKIYIPQPSGYKLASATIISANNGITFEASLHDTADVQQNLKGSADISSIVTSKYLSSGSTVPLELVTSSNISYIKVYHSKSTENHYNCKGITLTYVLAE